MDTARLVHPLDTQHSGQYPCTWLSATGHTLARPRGRHVQVNPQFYAFRWITLLLTQEFPFPDTVRLWDTVLASPRGRQPCLLRLCTAMLLHLRAQLLQVSNVALCST